MTAFAAALTARPVQVPGPVFGTPWNAVSWYWLWWAILSFTGFIVMELYQVATGHPENTLSAQVWRMLGVVSGQDIIYWNVAHFLFIILLIALDVWLIGHFGWGIWA